MNRLRYFLTAMIILMACLVLGGRTPERYRLRFFFSGQARGTILIFFHFRFYYEASAEIGLTAEPDGEGGLRLQLEEIRGPAYVLRTLGFSGRGLVMIAAGTDYEAGRRFSDERIDAWREEKPEFSRYIRKIVRLPYHVGNIVPRAFRFVRSREGTIRDVVNDLQLQYRYHPQKTGIYFQIYDLMAEILGFFDHNPWPDSYGEHAALPPGGWKSAPIDLTATLNRVGARTEKIVASAVEFEQEEPLTLLYRAVDRSEEEMEIAGENQNSPRIWRRFRLHRLQRRLRVRLGNRLPLRDELKVEIRNGKDQGGGAYLLLERVTP